jgi:hypothetical protein
MLQHPSQSSLQGNELEAAGMCRYSAGGEAHVLWGIGIRGPSEVTELVERLNAAGKPTLDISGIEAAQVIGHPPFLAGCFKITMYATGPSSALGDHE